MNKCFIILLLVTIIQGKDIHTLTFKDSVWVKTPSVHLKDILQEEVDPIIGIIDIGQSAPPGLSRFLNTKKILLQNLNRRFPNKKFVIQGHKRIRIFTESKKMSLELYRDTIKSHIKKQLSWKEEQCAVTLVNSDYRWSRYTSKENVKILGNVKAYHRGNVRLFLIVEQFGVKRKIPVVCKISVTSPVVVLSGNLSRGDIITKDNTRVEERDITFYRQQPITEKSMVIGRQVNRHLKSGQIVSYRELEKEYLVKKDDVVNLLYSNNRVRLSLKVRARSNGNSGHVVTVENVHSGKILKGKVIKKGVVLLVDGGLL